MNRPLIAYVIAAALAAPLASACVPTHARTTPEAPPLDVPAPPPRVIDSNDPEPQEPVPLPEEPAHHPPSRVARPPVKAEPRTEPPRAEAPKPAEAPPPQAETPKPADEAPKPAPPATTLQTAPTQAEGEVERGVRNLLTRAQSDLSRVDYRVLNDDARGQYDQAKSLLRQADDALRAKNLMFARAVADKAAAIAAQLAGR